MEDIAFLVFPDVSVWTGVLCSSASSRIDYLRAQGVTFHIVKIILFSLRQV
jgi:hypothetical protein